MIGVFDSGVGGLTVLKVLRAELPDEDLLYLGDTARLPYGTKSPETVVAYAMQATAALLRHNIKALVIACNTATAHALPALVAAYPQLPVIGVIGPGAQVAAQYKKILVLATEGTVRSGAYTRAIHALNPAAQVEAIPAGLLVAMAEEGWTSGAEVEAVIARYLKGATEGLEALVLGCTHFPLLSDSIRKVIGADVILVDSAQTTAKAVAKSLTSLKLLGGTGSMRLLATDGRERFAKVAAQFLGQPVAPEAVELVNL